MKKVKGISEVVRDLEGNAFKTKKEDKIVDMTVKDLLMALLAGSKPANGEESIKILAMALSLKDSTEDWDFYEEDEATLKRIINDNIAQYTSIAIALVYSKVKEAIAFKK